MARDLSDISYRPAQGLQRLTWNQIRIIDSMIGSLCGFTEGNRDHEALLILKIKNGKLRHGYTTALGEVIQPLEMG
jgi:hypothetical protein